MLSPALLSPRGLFAPEHEYFRAVESPRSPDPSRKPPSPDLSSLPQHSFAARSLEDRDLPQLSGVTRASLLEVRPAPATISTGIAGLDTLTSGIPRGALTEIFGPASSGRTSVLLALLAEVTRRQEVCALVDVSDSFHPHSAAAAGVDLDRLLWIRCGVANVRYPEPNVRHPERSVRHPERSEGSAVLSSTQPPSIPERKVSVAFDTLAPSGASFVSPGRQSWERLRGDTFHALEQALKITDLLLQSGGFGLIAVDLGDIPPQIARRVPLTSWFRFRRAVENTPTILLVMEQEPYAKTCASLVLKMQSAPLSKEHAPTAELPTHARLLRGLGVTAELVRSRTARKPPVSATAFETKTLATSF